MKVSFMFVLFVLNLLSVIKAYKTVVLVHGLNSNEGEFYKLKPHIEAEHPGTTVIGLHYSPDSFSLDPLHVQLDWFKRRFQEVLETTDGDVHLVCHSQGGLVCMGHLMLHENPRVHTFIALSSPLFGQYGLTADILKAVPALRPFVNIADEAVTEFLYTSLIQNAISVSNYWRDPRSTTTDKYEQVAIYLPVVLNDPRHFAYNQTVAMQRKKNFLSLKKLVLFGGPDDQTIKPWQSPLFGYFDGAADSKKVVNMTEQKVFQEDWFGLQTMHKDGRLQRYVIPGILHGGWVDDENVFKNFIAQWLV